MSQQTRKIIDDEMSSEGRVGREETPKVSALVLQVRWSLLTSPGTHSSILQRYEY
jgi:hypothetical protein